MKITDFEDRYKITAFGDSFQFLVVNKMVGEIELEATFEKGDYAVVQIEGNTEFLRVVRPKLLKRFVGVSMVIKWELRLQYNW